jgi:hypothetical protein
MTRSLGRRIEPLERDTHVGEADIDRARAIMRAFDMVRDHPEQATDEDRALAEDWQTAFGVLIDALGGLAAAVRGSYEIEAAEKPKQIEGQVVKQVPAE